MTIVVFSRCLHDRFSEPTRFQLGDRVWIYTPRVRRGLSKKLAHNWHGPYRIVQFLSPVHCILRAVDNRRVSTIVHVTRLKRYVDPTDRPTRQPLTDVDEPFLGDSDLPPDSFLSDTDELGNVPPATGDDGGVHDFPVVQDVFVPDPDGSSSAPPIPPTPSRARVRPSSSRPATLPAVPDMDDTDEEDLAADGADIYQVEKIVKHRIHGGQPQFLIKWAGFPDSHNSWEPRENILDDRVFKQYFQTCPRAKRLLNEDPDFNPRVATLSWTDSGSGSPIIAVLITA